ncbi:DNA-directed RNA polymerase subunit E' [uncultured archaeon]|nr:DNA-directed RNA polymerase subunit E' [uncultured archaeon]
MFEMANFEDEIRVPPENIGGKKEDVVLKSLVQKYENHIIPDVGVVLAVTQASDVKGGTIKADDPGIFYSAKFEAMLFVPKLHEIIEGQVIDITDFGVFVRFGPIDGMCHISQVMNDYVSRDPKANVIVGKKTAKVLKIGDTVRARITAISLEKKEVNKITITMRQDGLGSLDWIEAERKEKEKKAKKAGEEEKPKEKGKKEK